MACPRGGSSQDHPIPLARRALVLSCSVARVAKKWKKQQQQQKKQAAWASFAVTSVPVLLVPVAQVINAASAATAGGSGLNLGQWWDKDIFFGLANSVGRHFTSSFSFDITLQLHTNLCIASHLLHIQVCIHSQTIQLCCYMLHVDDTATPYTRQHLSQGEKRRKKKKSTNFSRPWTWERIIFTSWTDSCRDNSWFDFFCTSR